MYGFGLSGAQQTCLLKQGHAGGVTLKLRLPDFKLRTRAQRLPPTQLAPRLFAAARAMLAAQPAGVAAARVTPPPRRSSCGC